MSTNLTVIADLKAGLEALTVEVGKLKATQPNLNHFANELGGHLVKFEANVTTSFTDKFVGNLFRATEAWNGRVVKVEETLANLELVLIEQLEKYDDMLASHRETAAGMLEDHEKTIKKLLASNEQKLAEQQSAVSQVLTILAAYDKQFVTLYNGSVGLVESNEQTVEKIDIAVDKFDRISTGHLEEVAKKAEEIISLTSSTAKREMEKVVADTQMHVEGTRKRYLKTLTALDNRVLEHPILFVLGMILVVAVFFGWIGIYIGRRDEARHTQQLIDNSVEVVTQNVEERMKRIDEQTKSLNDTFQDAQYWEELTKNMSYDQKMAYIKQSQAEAQRFGRKLGLPKSMKEEKAKK